MAAHLMGIALGYIAGPGPAVGPSVVAAHFKGLVLGRSAAIGLRRTDGLLFAATVVGAPEGGGSGEVLSGVSAWAFERFLSGFRVGNRAAPWGGVVVGGPFLEHAATVTGHTTYGALGLRESGLRLGPI